MDNGFDPDKHICAEPKRFDEFEIGETFVLPSRTMTDAFFTLFQAVSGDNHPIHYDREYCRKRGHPDLLAHGFLVLIQTAVGAGLMPHLAGDALIGFIEQSSRFLKPVYAGDTLYPRLVISALKPQRTTGVMTLDMTVHNQKGELVLDGWHKYLLRLAPAGGETIEV
jgi:acyl dehydratase